MRTSLRMKLIGIQVLLLVLGVASGVVGLSGSKKQLMASEVIVNESMPSLAASGQLQIVLLELRLAYIRQLVAVDAESRAAALEGVKQSHAAFSKALDAYKAVIDTNAKQIGYEVIAEDYAAYVKLGAEFLNMVEQGMQSGPARHFADKMEPLGEKIRAGISDLIALDADAARGAAADASQTASESSVALYIMIAITLLIASMATAGAIFDISNPILRITSSMRRLAAGDVATAIPYTSRRDEIGLMAQSVEIFRKAAIHSATLEHEANENRIRSEADRVAARDAAEAAAAMRLASATSGLASGLKRLAAGDLSFSLEEPFSNEFEALRSDFNTSIQQLGLTLAVIADGATAIDSCGQEMSAASVALSRRTEQQAASLEESAAALNQIVEHIRQSVTRIQDARMLTHRAKDDAAATTVVATDTQVAMRRIESCSKEIATILSVINEIAFQTNLLALNAGVEAARAGESGKGFAVVAHEVRELAQRSATAADEIKVLIDRSRTEIFGGVKLVESMTSALSSITTSISAIHSHIDAVADSSKDQLAGLSEINGAISEVDRSTQQNSAMAEEAAAVAANLMSVTANLNSTIGQFQLRESAPRMPEDSPAIYVKRIA
ncbi:HAMP domain-containing methyl-accepting chemotaxis protein [Shinella kummerowiae]|uniref:HAMP domain-containing methyl-accepting chemotaxis protein n=1 Tax=Shinella kummerowiae TaxID=417745 RepID=UPI0021B4F97D|nr:methyl-accepting chemotaxis protein [Shinella kummerowiae]MCT7667352.1 methyl-accepting chemotaxis protein [Shinella kummerowiae]